MNFNNPLIGGENLQQPKLASIPINSQSSKDNIRKVSLLSTSDSVIHKSKKIIVKIGKTLKTEYQLITPKKY